MGIVAETGLPKGFEFRPVDSSLYEQGYLELLGHLTQVGNISQQQFADQLKVILSQGGQPWVLYDTSCGRIAAAGTLLVEHKFIHSCGKVGHIEDIVVSPDYRGQNFGRLMIDHLTNISKKHGTYKILLSCAEKNVGFYEKCGLTQKEITMAFYFQE